MYRHKKHIHSFTALAAGLLGIALTGCDQAKPTTYQIPKEERPVNLPTAPASAPANNTPAAAPGQMQVLPGMKEAAAQAGGILYTAPEGWTELPASGVRKGSFQIQSENGSADVSITVFPGDVGGVVANINRWAGQVGLSPMTEAEANAVAKPYTISEHKGLLISLKGETQSVLGGLLNFHGYTWFFKMKGDAAVVLQQEGAMQQFLDSIELEDSHH